MTSIEIVTHINFLCFFIAYPHQIQRSCDEIEAMSTVNTELSLYEVARINALLSPVWRHIVSSNYLANCSLGLMSLISLDFF